MTEEKKKPARSTPASAKAAAGKQGKKATKKTALKKQDAAAPALPNESSGQVSQKKKTTKKHEPAVSGIRIKLNAFDYHVLDEAAGKIIDTSERSGAVIHGPLPLPTIIKKFTVNKSTFVHKNSRDQYEMRIHRRLIDLTDTTFKTVEGLQNLSLPSGVDIEIQMR
ncbi:30S ribosomal protein S10 [Candidatus Peregrinibacteria bacterium CG10_big_fil_rev_8_21_14_0_10_49_16]|nr:MAG: 30S ribosomal protein S10 [Candidatus Peregrinibacteria bacterium CG22_combo_CG10-13_8_21_14_all_49_11]PIR52402.1 MAG: 30S ribosomal protein S10 [Candidatus Peregrinibacteria bacterium CG10_big_fil_rev_8_21_14_0_10_49_16]